MEKAIKEKIKDLTKTEAAKVVGAEAAKKALAAGIETVVFDRGGYIYTAASRVSQTAREKPGLNSERRVYHGKRRQKTCKKAGRK